MLDPQYCILLKEGAEKGIDMAFGNSGSREREATPEGPLWDLVFIWNVFWIAVLGFLCFLLGESCCRLH